MAASETTKMKAIRESRTLLQTFGFNGFSFQHIAEKLGIKKQSLYVHFESKEALAFELLADYKTSFETWTETVEPFEPEAKLAAWFDRFYKLSCENARYCVLNALTSDFNSLPTEVQSRVAALADERRGWIENVIAEGQKKKIFRKDLSARALSDLMLTLGFGSQQIARLANDPEKIKSLKKDALKILLV